MRKVILIIFIIIISFCGCNNSKTNTTTMKKSQTTVTTVTAEVSTVETTQKINTDSRMPVVLYHGIPIDTIDQDYDYSGESKPITKEQKQALSNKYNRNFYLYSNNKLIDQEKGKIESRGLDYYWCVTFKNDNYEVAISKSFNPYPRKVKYFYSNFPKEFNQNINEINKQFNVNCKIKKLSIIDLDGNGKTEKIILVADYNKQFIAKCLIDSNNKMISYLMILKDEDKCVNFNELFDMISSSEEIIDVNNDKIMEILMDMPTYEGFDFNLYKYKNGKFDGEYINQCSIHP